MDRTKECISFRSVYCLLTFYLLACFCVCLSCEARERERSRICFSYCLAKRGNENLFSLPSERRQQDFLTRWNLNSIYWFCVQCYSIIKGQYPRIEKPLRDFVSEAKKLVRATGRNTLPPPYGASQASIKPSMWGF